MSLVHVGPRPEVGDLLLLPRFTRWPFQCDRSPEIEMRAILQRRQGAESKLRIKDLYETLCESH